MNENIYVVITAAGVGNRMGYNIPKQFIYTNEYIFVTTIKKFINFNIKKIILVISKEWEDFVSKILLEKKLMKYVDIVYGGETADESRWNSLLYLKSKYNCDNDIIIFHDAVRPNTSYEIIENAIKLCIEYDAAIPTIICKDSMCLLENGKISYIDNKNKIRLQTPQSFIFNKIYLAYSTIKKNNEEWLGSPILNYLKFFNNVITFEGEEVNFKITTKDDLELYKKIQ